MLLGGAVVTYAYVLENIDITEKRNNQPLFLLIEQLEVTDDNIYVDKDTDTERNELMKLLAEIKPYSKLLVRSIVDLAETFTILKSVLQKLTEKKIVLFSCEEPFLCGDEFLEYLTAFAKMFVVYERKKQRMGYNKALENGLVGRPKKSKEVEQAIKLYNSGLFKISQIEIITGVSKSTLYRYLKMENAENTTN